MFMVHIPFKNKDRFEHEIVLKIVTKSEPRCSYKIVLIRKKEFISFVVTYLRSYFNDVLLDFNT